MSVLIVLADILTVFALVVGGVFTLVGSIGLLKLNDPMKRVHAPTKAATLGIGALLFGSMLFSFAHGDGSMHEVLIMGFLFLTAPISAQFISKVNMHRRDCEDVPPPPRDDVWAVQDVPEEDKNFGP